MRKHGLDKLRIEMSSIVFTAVPLRTSVAQVQSTLVAVVWYPGQVALKIVELANMADEMRQH